MIAAGDTFRAAAEDQLKIWSERVGCTFFFYQREWEQTLCSCLRGNAKSDLRWR